MKFLFNAWKIHIKRLKKPLLSFIALTATTALLGGVVVAMRGHFSSGKDSFHKLTIAVCDKGEDERTDLALGMLSGMEDVKQYADFVPMEEQQARKQLEAGKISAIAVMPTGFIDGILYGENLSPKLILNRKNPLENILLLSLAEGVTGMLSAAQSGIYTVMDFLPSSVSSAEKDKILLDINMEYISWTLARNDMFSKQALSASGELTLIQHYLLMGILWFLALSAPILFRIYSVREEAAVLVRMKSMGVPLRSYFLGKWLAGFFAVLLITGGAALLLIFVLQKAGIGISLSLAVMGGFFLTALFMTSWGYCCANLCRTSSGQVLLCFLLTITGMFAAGGILPTLLLPPFFTILEKLSPFYYLKLSLAPLFYKEVSVQAMGLVAAVSLLLPMIISVWISNQLKKEGGA